MEISLEKEFELAKTMLVFNKVCEKLGQYQNDLQIVDIPEFCKMPEDRIEARADKYLARVISEGRLDEVYNKIIV